MAVGEASKAILMLSHFHFEKTESFRALHSLWQRGHKKEMEPKTRDGVFCLFFFIQKKYPVTARFVTTARFITTVTKRVKFDALPPCFVTIKRVERSTSCTFCHLSPATL